ncbi:MAG: putative type-F conjugative transfer system pilin assembly protein TrbC [Gammaproteobacteria bacterium]|jgi:conjugal transfer pilus assembly protein TrbC|nr:putative type-F conjugative transfer system pilin assembly protein TrbC [Gammaproteobacteria bacterium]
MRYFILIGLLFFVERVAAEIRALPPLAHPPVIIFVSFSMPKESLREWIEAGEMIHAPLVLRGLVNNSFKETVKKVNELIQNNHGGIQIDPTLFKKFHITQVPAVVVSNSATCLLTSLCPDEFDVVYGDVELAYALRKIRNEKDSLSPIAEKMLNTLYKGNHA